MDGHAAESWGHGWTIIPFLARNQAQAAGGEGRPHLKGRVRSRE